MFIIDCPDCRYIDQLAASKQFLGFADESKEIPNCRLKLVIHLAESAVLTHPVYKEWMLRFNNAEHIFVNGALRECVKDQENLKCILKNFKYYELVE